MKLYILYFHYNLKPYGKDEWLWKIAGVYTSEEELYKGTEKVRKNKKYYGENESWKLSHKILNANELFDEQ